MGARGRAQRRPLLLHTRSGARDPQKLEDMSVLDQATGVVMAAQAVDEARAREIIAAAARQAGQDELSVALEVIRPFLGDPYAS